MRSRRNNWEPALVALLAAAVLAPTALVLVVGIRALNQAAEIFEVQIRRATTDVADAVAFRVLSEAESELAAAEDALFTLADKASPRARLALAEQVPLSSGVAIIDETLGAVYPGRSSSQGRRLSEADEQALLEVQKARWRAGGEGAVAKLEKLLAAAEPESPLAVCAANELAGLLAARGALGEAGSIYEKNISAEDVAGRELSVGLLAAFRAWRIDPSAKREGALAEALLSRSISAPRDQIRFYLQKLAEGEATWPAVAEVRRVLEERERDESFTDAARLLAASMVLSSDRGEGEGEGADEGGEEDWHLEAHFTGGRPALAGVRRLVLADGRKAFAVIEVDTEKLKRRIEDQLAQRVNSSPVRYVLGGSARGAPGEGEVALEVAFPAPLASWSLAVIAPRGGLRTFAEARTRLLVWTMGLGAAATAVGVGVVLFWARRRARLARLQTDFVANVTHELKTPLTAIKSLAETLHLGRVRDEAKRGEFIEAIVRESDRLARLVANVLDFSRLERSGVTLHLEETDLVTLVEAAVASFELAVAEEDDVDIELALPGEGLPANVDRDAVTGILFNLLDNAYKYSRPPRRIKVTLVERDSQALLSVADNGVGLTARQRLRVFGKFYRASTSLAAGTQGAGLGLSLVKAYARAHGGSVAVASTPGEGSTFEVTLPLSRGER